MNRLTSALVGLGSFGSSGVALARLLVQAGTVDALAARSDTAALLPNLPEAHDPESLVRAIEIVTEARQLRIVTEPLRNPNAPRPGWIADLEALQARIIPPLVTIAAEGERVQLHVILSPNPSADLIEECRLVNEHLPKLKAGLALLLADGGDDVNRRRFSRLETDDEEEGGPGASSPDSGSPHGVA